MTKPKAILPGRIFIAKDRAQLEAISWDENCRLNSLAWLESTDSPESYPARHWFVATELLNPSASLTADQTFKWEPQVCECDGDPVTPPETRKPRYLCALDEPDALDDFPEILVPGMSWPAGTLEEGKYIVTFNAFYRVSAVANPSTAAVDTVKFQFYKN